MISRRAFGGLALGGMASRVVHAREPGDNPCQMVLRERDWRMIVTARTSPSVSGGHDLSDTWQSLGYYVDLTFVHDPTDLTISVTRPEFSGGNDWRFQVTGIADIFERIDGFRADIIENRNRRLLISFYDYITGMNWQVAGRGEVVSLALEDSEIERVSVSFDVSSDQAGDLFEFLLLDDQTMYAAADIILDDGSTREISNWDLSTHGLYDLWDQSGSAADRLLRSQTISHEQCGRSADGCFLTTACCTVFGRPDDGFELSTLRAFRDEWLAHQPGGPDEIAQYYRIAPAICTHLSRDPAGRWELFRIYAGTILPCVALVRLGLNRTAHRLYHGLVRRLASKYSLAQM